MNTFFISLDVNLGFTEEMKNWLENEIKKSQFYDFRIVFFHIPPYSSRKHGNNLDLIENLVPILEKNNVHLVLSGHNHGYEASYPLLKGKPVKKGGIIYIISAIGGANNLYESLSRPEWSRIEKTIKTYLKIKVDQDKIYIETKDDGSRFAFSYANLKENKTISDFIKYFTNDFNYNINNTNQIFEEITSWIKDDNFISNINLYLAKLDKVKDKNLILNIEKLINNLQEIETNTNNEDKYYKRFEILSTIYQKILITNYGPNIVDKIEFHKNSVIK